MTSVWTSAALSEWKDPERRGFRDLKSIVATPMLDEREAAEEDPQQTRFRGLTLQTAGQAGEACGSQQPQGGDR